MKTKTVYIASDGSEHESPQGAAQMELENTLCRLIEQAGPGISTHDLVILTTGLARNPEALRDALDTYFEDLEAHPDVDDPANVFHGIPLQHASPGWYGEFDTEFCGTAYCNRIDVTVAEDGSITSNGTGTFQLDGDPDNPSTWRVVSCDGDHKAPACPDPQCWHKQPLKEGEIAPGVRGFEMVVGASHEMPKDKDRYVEGTLPVDHPNYCRPFGTRED